MSATVAAPAVVRFHMSLNVRDLDRSIAFYRVLFGVEPAKRRPDYAKFELDEPPLVLSLEPHAHQGGGALNHVGFRMPDAKSLVAMQERLEQAGIRAQREEGVECCYAKQTKFWAHDPDRTLWEVYTFDGDIEHRGHGQSAEAIQTPIEISNGSQPVVFEHRMNETVPQALPLSDNSADEVRLRGTLNLPLPAQVQERLVREAFRVLKPAGKLFVHVLAGDKELASPGLPGPASAVQHVPLQSQPIELLKNAGFASIRMIKFDARPCFERQGVAMRECQIEAWKETGANGASRAVLYKGPFRQVTDDHGTVYPRGEWVRVPSALAQRLTQGELANQFVVVG